MFIYDKRDLEFTYGIFGYPFRRMTVDVHNDEITDFYFCDLF